MPSLTTHNTPALRFPGYTGVWEQRRLGDIAIEINAGGDVNKMLLKPAGQYPVIANALTNDGIVGYYDDYYRIQSPAVTVTARGNIGHATARMTNFTPIVRLLTIISKHDSYFLEHAINNIKIIVESTGVPQLTVPQLSQYKIAFPVTMMEEKTIGSFFRHVDGLINLHQRQTQKLKKLKQGLLHEMFPREGESVPRLRFPGFTTNWEQQRLGNITNRITRKNTHLESDIPLTLSAQYGLIDQNEFFTKRIASKDISGYYLVRNGEFAYNKSTSSDAPWGAIERLDRYDQGVLSTLYIVFGVKDPQEINSDYLVSYYQTNLWHRGIQAIASEGARNHGLLNITPADFFDTTISVPSDYREQSLIGSFFRTLDDCIHCHERYVTTLIHLKKGLLQKMFPREG